MKVRIEKSYPLPGPAPLAWEVLGDIEAVAACMPGARITERIDDTHYKGTVAVKFGPASLNFRGEIEVLELAPEARRLRLLGKGTDSTGSSGAAMDLTARIDEQADGSSQLVGDSEVSMSGKVASFGARMAGAVADQVLKQFVANFAARVQAAQDPSPHGEAEPVVAAPLSGMKIAGAVVKGWLK